MKLAAVVAIVVAGATVGACGKKGRQRRTGDAAPVEVVARPIARDAASERVVAEEVEPNDDDDVATPLTVGGAARARIEPDGDRDFFAIDIADPGVLSLRLSAIEDFDLALELEDATGTVIARSDRAGANVAEGIPNAGVTPGRYLVVVSGKRWVPPTKRSRRRRKPPVDAAVGPAPVYELGAGLTALAAGSEQEPNDDRGTAAELIVGDAVTGYVGWNGDDDTWKLSVELLSDNNALDVEVSAVDGVALTVEIADGIGRAIATRRGRRGGAVALRGLVPRVPQGSPPFHYLTVRGDRSNPDTTYQVRVSAKLPGPDAELEPNDAADAAMPVPADRTVVHATWSPGDVDYFVLGADAAPRTVEVTADTPAESDLTLELLLDGKVVAKAAQGGKGAAERASAAVPAGAQLVVRVDGSKTSGEGAYDLQIAEGPAPAP